MHRNVYTLPALQHKADSATNAIAHAVATCAWRMLWKAELDAFFQRREQQDQQQQQLDHAQPSPGETAIETFMATVATPAFEEFGAALRVEGAWPPHPDTYGRLKRAYRL